MKKIILSFAFICAVVLSSQAQGLYFGGGIGYGFSAGGTVLGSNQNADGSSQVVKGSYGMGFTPNLSVGYLFTENLGAELNLGYLIGTNTTVTDANGNTTGTTKYSANTFYLNPSFVIRGNSENKVVPYGKLGVFLGVANMGSVKSHTDQVNGNGNLIRTEDTQTDLKGSVSTGITSAFGVDFMLTDNFAIYGELNGRLASFAPDTYSSATTTTLYANNGAFISTTPSSVSGNFVNTTPNNYNGTDTPTQVFPLSAIGFSIGVRYYLF